MEYNMNSLKEFTQDYAERTIANFKAINKLHKQEEKSGEVFEVTQLINSLFGILIMPFESVKATKNGQINPNTFRDINIKMEKANPEAFNDLSVVINELKEAHLLYDSYAKDFEKDVVEITFVHRLRNSLAHSGDKGLRFYPIGERDQKVGMIKSIIFCDEEKNAKGESFIAELTVEQVERVVKDLAAIFSNYSEFDNYHVLEDYQNEIDNMRKKMKNIYEGIFDFDKSDLKEVEKKFKLNLTKEKISDSSWRGRTMVFDEMDFLTWIFQSGGKYKLVGPEKACERFDEIVNSTKSLED